MLSPYFDVSPTIPVLYCAGRVPPIDYGDVPTSMSGLIRCLTHASERLDAAVAGLTLTECERAICADEQPIRNCIEHIAIYGLDWSEMFYRSVSNIYPTQRGNNTHWKERLAAEALTGMRAALEVYRKHNKSIADFLALLPASDFDRPFAASDSDSDPFVIKDSLYWGLVEHCDSHLATIQKMRIALGKPLDWMAVYHSRYARPN